MSNRKRHVGDRVCNFCSTLSYEFDNLLRVKIILCIYYLILVGRYLSKGVLQKTYKFFYLS